MQANELPAVCLGNAVGWHGVQQVFHCLASLLCGASLLVLWEGPRPCCITSWSLRPLRNLLRCGRLRLGHLCNGGSWQWSHETQLDDQLVQRWLRPCRNFQIPSAFLRHHGPKFTVGTENLLHSHIFVPTGRHPHGCIHHLIVPLFQSIE